jgi:hypothetical protein
LAPGSYIVSVQSVLDSTQKASSQVSVVPASAMRMTPIEFTAKTGDTVQLNLVGVAVGSTITWTVAHSEDGTPGGGTVDANGLFTAGSQPGLFIVRASAGSDSVSGAATIIAQQITPVDALVSLGGTCAFSTATYDSSNSVNWSILEPAGGTITSSGLYTAPLQQGQYHVLAQTSQGHIAMATVTVGPPDGFILSPEIDVLLAGTYQVQVRLKASNGQTTRSIFSGDLPLGVSSPNVVFSQDKIKKDLGVDGPYSVDQVVLSQLVTDELLKVDNKEALGMTGNYPIAEADIPWILIGTIQSIVAEDSNGNGLIDTFHVPISVDVIFDGDYPITATLTCGNGSEIASTQLLPRLLKGKNVITLSFDGRQIYQSGQEGPYGIGNFSVSGPVTRSQSFPGAFAGYSRIQFEH